MARLTRRKMAYYW